MGLRSFRGITTAPILNNDGALRNARGYDADSGLWCYNVPELKIPQRPTEEDAKAALLQCRRFFRTFPFADGARVPEGDIEVIDINQPPGLDESTFLAALLTAVCRQSLEQPRPFSFVHRTTAVQEAARGSCSKQSA